MIKIDMTKDVPLEEQIRGEIRQAIARGETAPGDELPSVRQLAADLGIHWNTVARAYRRLRDDGLLVVGRGRGVHVRQRPESPPWDTPDTRAHVSEKVREAVTEARLAGMPLDRFRQMITQELSFWEEAEGGS